jgi:ABC-type polysaccharide/polyol phosphate export permease
MKVTIDLRYVIGAAILILGPIFLIGYILAVGLVLGYPYVQVRHVATIISVFTSPGFLITSLIPFDREPMPFTITLWDDYEEYH